MKRIFYFLSILLLAVTARAERINVATQGIATINGALWGPGGWDIQQIIDGDLGGVVHADQDQFDGYSYTIDLGRSVPIDQIKIYPRQDACCPDRLSNFRVIITQELGGAEVHGVDMFTDGSNAGNGQGTVVTIDLPTPKTGQFVEIRSLASPVPAYALQMTEVQIFAEVPAGEVNRALNTVATSNRDLWAGRPASLLVDGNRSGRDPALVHGLAGIESPFMYEINLGTEVDMNRIVIVPRRQACCPDRLSNYRVSVHKNSDGAIGEEVWSADLHTDGTDAGSLPTDQDVLTPDIDPDGTMKGQWVRIQSLSDPVPDYALQIAEVEVFGTPAAGVGVLVAQEPRNVVIGVGQTATFNVTATVVGGDPSLLTYQWQADGANIDGATESTYTTPPIVAGQTGKKYRVVLKYPGIADVISAEATATHNIAFGATAESNRPLYAGWNVAGIVNGSRADVYHGNTDIEAGFAYTLRLVSPAQFNSIDIYPRLDGCCPERLTNFRVSLHNDNNGSIGDQVWSADLFTDGSNPGASSGSVVHLTADLDPAGQFKGQWIRILSLEDPVQNYALQISEVEAFGTLEDTSPKILLNQQPADIASAPYRTARFVVGASMFNAPDQTLLTYQWKKNGQNIEGATSAVYVTPLLADSDAGAKYSVELKYPGATTVLSREAELTFNYNYAIGGRAFSNRPIWGGQSVNELVDGNTRMQFHGDVAPAAGFAYEVDLGDSVNLEKINIYPRQDGCCPERLTNFRVSVHTDNNGSIGEQVWSTDLFTDGSNAGSEAGLVVVVTPDLDPAGTFAGRWIRVLSLDDPIGDYALQMTELEAIGRINPPLRLTVNKVNNGHTLSWSAGVLESADEVTGASWNPVEGATSPFPLPASGARKFYRLKQ